jgi:hypothetical protein
MHTAKQTRKDRPSHFWRTSSASLAVMDVDRGAHDESTSDFSPGNFLRISKIKCQAQCGVGKRDGKRNRQNYQEGIKPAIGSHLHGHHVHVM